MASPGAVCRPSTASTSLAPTTIRVLITACATGRWPAVGAACRWTGMLPTGLNPGRGRRALTASAAGATARCPAAGCDRGVPDPVLEDRQAAARGNAGIYAALYTTWVDDFSNIEAWTRTGRAGEAVHQLRCPTAAAQCQAMYSIGVQCHRGIQLSCLILD